MLSTTNTEFSFIEKWFTEVWLISPLKIKDNVNLTLIIGLTLKKEIFNRSKF